MASSRRDQWADSPLYIFLSDIFPTYRTVLGKFDVLRLARDLSLSHEAVYKWLRKGSLSPQNANAVLDLALTLENIDALVASDMPRPELRDFDQFVYRRVT